MLFVEEMNERLKKFLDFEGMSVRQFEATIGSSDGKIAKFLTSNSSLKSDTLNMIMENFPQLSIEWLLTGKGSMLKAQPTDTNMPAPSPAAPAPIAHKVQTGGIPLIPIDAIAGFANGDDSAILEYECEHYVIPMFREADFLIPVKGSSMQPKYNSGDLVACKRLALSDLFFQWNHVYVLSTEQGALIKRVQRANDEEHITCVSDNEKYPPFTLHRSQIHAIALVIGVIRLE